MSLPNFFKSDEEKANEESNERKIEEIWDDINRCAELLNTNIADLQNKYDNKIIPYENKDDEYASKAGGLYSKYTSAWEYIKESIKDSVVDTVDMIKGLLKSVADLVVGAFGLIKGIAIYAAAGVAIDIKEVTGEVPDWMQYCIDKSDEYNNTILEVLKDPGLIIEGLSQSVSDAYEEKGIAYASGYVAGEVVQLCLTDGISEVKEVSTVEKVVTKVDDLSKTAEDISGVAGKTADDLRYEQYWKDVENGKYDIPYGMTTEEYLQYLEGQNKVDKEIAKVISNTKIFKFSEMSEEEIAKIVKEYREKAPIEIPETAKTKAQSKVGYEQISYKWNDGTYKYEARWHTRTPEAPIEQGNTWVIQRTKPGSGGTKPTTEFKLGEDEWILGYKWYDAIAARKAGTATPEQIKILDRGHWKE